MSRGGSCSLLAVASFLCCAVFSSSGLPRFHFSGDSMIPRGTGEGMRSDPIRVGMGARTLPDPFRLQSVSQFSLLLRKLTSGTGLGLGHLPRAPCGRPPVWEAFLLTHRVLLVPLRCRWPGPRARPQLLYFRPGRCLATGVHASLWGRIVLALSVVSKSCATGEWVLLSILSNRTAHIGLFPGGHGSAL